MAFWPSYPDQMRSAIPYLVAAKHLARPCVIYEDSEFGRDALRGVEDAAHRLGLTVQERIAVRRDGNDAAPAVARLKGVGCDLIVFGTNVHEAAQALTEARRIGLEAEFLGTSALYTASIRESGGRVVDGLYAVNTVSYPYADDASRLVRDWTDAYRTRFKEDPTVFAVYGYCIFDLFAKAATRAGPNLSTDTFDAAMESTTFPRDMFGSPEYHISAADRLGSRKVRISQIVKGRWTAITPLLEAPATH
jgi:branched-chain amino acid transport system substrate-binding protein